MNSRETRIRCVESALRAVHREAERGAGTPSEACILRSVAGIRVKSQQQRQEQKGEAQFLWRFLSAGAVAASVLVGVALSNLPDEPLTFNSQADDMVATVMNPTMPF